MKLIKDIPNIFNVTIIINNINYLNHKLEIIYKIDNTNKYYYLIKTDCEHLSDFFDMNFVEGVKGFGQHIVSNEKFNLIYKEKTNTIQVITWDNTVFINGYLDF